MPRYERIDWYETPRYYDAVFDVDTDREADFLEAAFARYATAARGSGGLRVLEPACGSGRLLVELARRGWNVYGYDRAPEMVRYARERLEREGLRGTVAEGDLASFRPRGRFDLAHCLVSTFKYLLDEDAARRHLACVAAALRPGGIYCLGFHLTDYARTSPTRERWVVRRDGMEVVCNIQGWPANRRKRTEEVRARLVVRERGEEKRAETLWTFRTYDARQVRRLLASVPELEHVATHDFLYDAGEELELSDEQGDTLLVLRRR